MCQLTLVKTHGVKLTRDIVGNQLIINSIKDHQDGVGILYKSNGNWWTLKGLLVPSHDVSTFYEEYIQQIDGGNTVLAHVRRASTKRTDITEDHAHPFFDKDTDLVFAHNGTLRYKKEFSSREVKDDTRIDSQIFFAELCKIYADVEGNIVEALQKTMEMFSGKFAFLIRDGNSDFYVVKGKTADLFKATLTKGGKSVGIIVNTELPSLVLNTNRVILEHANEGEKIEVAIEKLKDESIFKLDGYDLTLIGEIKETRETVITYNYSGRSYWYKGEVDTPRPVIGVTKNVKFEKTKEAELKEKTLLSTLIDKAKVLKISASELDTLLYLTVGKPLVAITAKDVREFCTGAFPKLLVYFNEENAEETRKKELLWTDIKDVIRVTDKTYIYRGDQKDAFLQFPWFVNTVEELETFLTQMKGVIQ